jgi:hypothetical protein
MPLRIGYECDVTGEKGDNPNDFTVFTIKQGQNEITTVVSTEWLAEEMEDNEALSSIVLHD